MSDKASKRKRGLREVYWICESCKTGNRRTIDANIVLNDDVCDYCHRRVHEPVLIDLKNDKQ